MVELVSVIVPTHNEDGNLANAIRSVRGDGTVEVIVADGESTDSTLAVARDLADRVVSAPRNRAAQLNAGAAVATGSILMFLHADSCLAQGSISAARECLSTPGVAGGAFTIRIGDEFGLRLITWGTNLRSRWLGLPYGDQAIFATARSFGQLGGFRRLEIMEDADFVRRLRRIGRIALIDMPVTTSPRRWQSNGLLRTSFANASALVMFRLGVAPHRIRRYYDSLVSGRAEHHESNP
jgi:rSAM/selenodomain-associated transferase 2